MLRYNKTNYPHFLNESELVTLMHAGKTQRSAVCDQLIQLRQIPWEEYYLTNDESLKKYYATRDYLILSKIKLLLPEKFNFPTIYNLVKQLSAPRYLLRSPKHNLTADDLKQHREDGLSNLKSILRKTLPHNAEEETYKTYRTLSEKSAIVVTFNMNKINFNESKGECLKNSFQVYAEGGEFKKDLNYFYNRIIAETVLYSHLSVRDLQLFSLHARLRPTYGSLQFFNCIKPITNYGSSFLVLTRDSLNSSTFTFGDTVDTTVKNKLPQPCLFSLPHSMDQQLSKEFKSACQTMLATGHFPKDFNFQYNEWKSQYIEAQLPSSICMNDPTQVSHIHVAFDNTMPQLKKIEQWMSSGITVSVDKNPFQSNLYSSTYQRGLIRDVFLQKTVDLIYRAALVLGETKPTHLSFELTPQKLRFKFLITPNSSNFHQAQAAHLLYLMGVRKAFTKISPIKFNIGHNHFYYDLLLNGKSVQLGNYKDQDAYTYDFGSMTQLLNIFMKRLIVSYLVSLQNADYFKQHQSPHPITGKGATEESNLAKELYLGDGKNQYDISIICLNDCLLIQIFSNDLRIYYQVFNRLLKLFPQCKRNDKYLLLPHDINTILKTFSQHRFNYLATIFEESGTTEKVLLALRNNPWEKVPLGFSSPGGHNNNPFTNIDVFQDKEFGIIKKEVKAEPILERKKFPTIIYWKLNTHSLLEQKLDPEEFVPNSLMAFNIYELGKLPPDQLKKVSACFHLTEEEYKAIFGCGLALRTVDSLLVYLDHFKNAINAAFEKKQIDCKVRIWTGKKNIKWLEKPFWVPDETFGLIQLRFSKKSELTRFNFNLHKLVLRIVTDNTDLSLHGLPPADLLHILQNYKYDYDFITLASDSNSFSYLMKIGLFDLYFELARCLPQMTLVLAKTIIENYQVDPCKILECGYSLMHQAAAQNRLDLLSYFINKLKCNINTPDQNQDTPLSHAIHAKQIASVKFLLANKAEVNGHDAPIVAAASSGNLPILKLLFECKADYSLQKKEGYFGVHAAVIKGHFEIISHLLTVHKVDPNQSVQDQSNFSPLALAINQGQTKLLKTLIQHKANLDMPCDSTDTMPLHAAAGLGHKEIMQYLLTEHKMDINQKDKKLNTPLHTAAMFGNTSSVLWLLEHKASAENKNETNETPLLAAIRNRQVECIIALYDHQIVFNALDKEFFDSLSSAQASNVIRCILAHEQETEMPALLKQLKHKFNHLPLDKKYNDSEEDMIAVAKLWKNFMIKTNSPCTEVLAIEQACGAFHKFRILEEQMFKHFPRSSMPEKCRTYQASFFYPGYLSARVDNLCNVMFPNFPGATGTPLTRRTFWEEYIQEIEITSHKLPLNKTLGP